LTNHSKTREWARLRQKKPDTEQQSQNRDRAHRPKLKGKRTEEHKIRCKKKAATSKQQNYREKINLNSGTFVRGLVYHLKAFTQLLGIWF
jgi:hypothetical protein